MKAMVKGILPVFGFALWLNGSQAIREAIAGENIDDTKITTTVKEKLAAEKMTFTGIEVDTNLGVVRLSGVVDSAVEKAIAEGVAESVDGVKRVINNLQVRAQK
jgi:hyperosmotically inducible protein